VAENLTVRPAVVSDAAGISALIHSQLHHRAPDPTTPAPEQFVALFSPQAIAGYITGGNCNYLVALIGGQLVGALAIRDNRHLFHLFVAEPYQRLGVARSLWNRAKADVLATTNEAEISVRSSMYAVPVYERFGFKVSGPRVEDVGVTCVPMQLVIRDGHC